jgi:8-oxo-dGTP diphosphatase
MMYKGEYTPPTLTIDSVVFQLSDKGLSILLIQRAAEPFKDCWALPGGYCAAGETTKDAMSRVLQAKAGLTASQLDFIEQLYAFDTVARDPRGHAVSITYSGLGKDLVPESSGTTQNPQFFPVNDLPKLAYDHADIIAYALQRLQSKLTYTNVVFALLPQEFTLTQLQTAYEAIINRSLDKRNFRRKILSLDFLKDTGKMSSKNAYRPARLYTFKQHSLQALEHIYE